MIDNLARYRQIMERTRHTCLTPAQILEILDCYLDQLNDSSDFGGFVALQGFRSAITGDVDFEALLAYLKGRR